MLSKKYIYLFVCGLFCLLLSLYRVWNTTSIFYFFLNWNAFLALVPMAVSSLLTYFSFKRQIIPVVLLFIWILFLPNAPYIVTDLVHLSYVKTTNIWFDLLLVGSFALFGLLAYLYSLQQVVEYLRKYIPIVWLRLFSLGVSFLVAFGVYLGRFLRWNSWELAQRPFSILEEVFEILCSPSQHELAWQFTGLFGAFLCVVSFVYFDTMKGQKKKTAV